VISARITLYAQNLKVERSEKEIKNVMKEYDNY
jgi:hypothetical protein